MNTTERLERLRNRLTSYEIAAIRGDQRFLVAYSQARSRHGLLRACQKRGAQIIYALGIHEAVNSAYATDMLIAARKASDGFTLGDWAVRFTGRTEREAILSGELPYIGDVVVGLAVVA